MEKITMVGASLKRFLNSRKLGFKSLINCGVPAMSSDLPEIQTSQRNKLCQPHGKTLSTGSVSVVPHDGQLSLLF